MSEDLNLSELAKENEQTNNETNEENVFSLPDSSFDLPLRISTFSSSKEFDKFIKNSERTIRHSQEYKLWAKYITEHLGHSKCALTNEKLNECSLDIHHHPITLYTIVKGVISQEMSDGNKFSTFDIATKTIELHFQNKIGYIVLLSNLHQKYHSGFLNLPIELVNGNYKHVLKNYSIEENEYDKICSLCNIHINDLKHEWKKDNYPGIESDQTDQLSIEEFEKKSKEITA